MRAFFSKKHNLRRILLTVTKVNYDTVNNLDAIQNDSTLTNGIPSSVCHFGMLLNTEVFLYWFEIYFPGLDSACKQILRKTFHACTRYVFGLPRKDNIDEHKCKILGFEILDYLEYHSLLFLHKVILSWTSSYIFEKLQFSRLNRRICNLIMPFLTTARTHMIHFTPCIALYKDLPAYIIHSNIVSGCKSSNTS